MNALMLALALRFGGWRIDPLRVMLGAAAGAAAAWAADGLTRMQTMLVWLPAAMLMMRIAGGGKVRLLMGALVLGCAAGLVGGMILAIWGAAGSLAFAYVLAGIAAAGIGVYAARRRQASAHVRLICAYRGKRAAFEAMIDSGNTLRDYLTHLPAIVIPENAGRKALALDGALLRPIFAQTAGGRQQMAVLVPQEVELEVDGVRHAVQAAIVLSPRMSESVPALVPASLLGECSNSNRGG